MISSGNVTSTATSIDRILSNYSSTTSGISTSSWKGSSRDNFDKQVNDFISFKSILLGQLNSFASACDNYTQYEAAKKKLKQLESDRSRAISNNSDVSGIDRDINSTRSKINSLKDTINSDLSNAKNGTLVATSKSKTTSNTTTTNTPVVDTSASSQDPNLIYSSKYPGYVFPFAKGINAPVNSSVGRRNLSYKKASKNHQGTDIGAPNKSEIRAIYSGTVVTAGDFGGYGKCVRIQQDDGYLTYYGHCSNVSYFKEGDRVEAGQVIGNVGSTGNSTGPHLHLEIRCPDYDKTKNIADSEEIFEGVWP